MSALPELKDQCVGRWAGVLSSLGMDERLFNGKHGPCIYCGGKDRARWVKPKEFYLCAQCGPHTPEDLAIHHLGLTYRDTAREIRKIIGGVKMEVVKTSDDYEKNRARIDRIRKGLKRMNGEDAASLYLANRGLKVLPDSNCYAHPGVEYWQDGVKSVHPAMVSMFRNVEGKTASMHIIYLTQDGKKADVEAPKKILPVILPLPGCAINLFEPENGVIAVAEGVETAMAVRQLEHFPVWACGNAGQMATLDVPESVNELLIYADEDESFTGAQAAYTLAKRMKAKGKKVSVIRLLEDGPYSDRGQIKQDFLDYAVRETSRQSGRNAPRSQTH